MKIRGRETASFSGQREENVMESIAQLHRNEYCLDEKYYFDVVHDFSSHCFDCWLHCRTDNRCVYLTTVRDSMSSGKILDLLRRKAPETVEMLEEKVTA